MIPGDVVDWSLSHRARGNVTPAPGATSPSLPEIMEFNIGTVPSGSPSTMIMRGASYIDGSDSTTAPQSRCPGTLGTCTRSVNSSSGWVTYSGQFTWASPPAKQTIGFQAISGMRNSDGSYSTNAGNYLDNINFTLKPFLHFTSSTATYTEGGTQPTVSVQIVGVLKSNITLTLGVSSSSTATSGSDYTLGNSGTITIPAGDYGLGSTFAAPITFNNDTVIENNETLILTIPAPGSNDPYMLANTNACGATPNNIITITIVDNDVNLLTTKTVDQASVRYGLPITYTVTYTNDTGAPTIAPLDAHNVTTAVTDAVPAGLTFTSWTCTGAGGGTCPATSGTGAISANAVLPAGGSVTYTITATLAGHTCTAISNTSSIAVPAGFTEGTSVQAGFTSATPPSPPSSNNTASVSVTPQCVDLRISKTNTNAVGPLDQASDTLQSGQTTTYTLLVENQGPAVTGAMVTDQPNATGLTCDSTATVSCTGSNPSICPSSTYTVADLTGSGITLGSFPTNAAATLTFSCTVKLGAPQGGSHVTRDHQAPRFDGAPPILGLDSPLGRPCCFLNPISPCTCVFKRQGNKSFISMTWYASRLSFRSRLSWKLLSDEAGTIIACQCCDLCRKSC